MIIGIDTGLSGGIAALKEDGSIYSYMDMPTISDGKRRFIDTFAIKEWIKQGDIVIIEKAQSMKQNGGVSMFNYGVSYGMLLGLFDGIGISYYPVHPATWKSKMLKDMPKGKESSVIRVRQAYPDVRLERVKDHNIAEAILIGLYGLKYIVNA